MYCKDSEKAHNSTERSRTEDVIIQDDIRFCDLLLSETTLKGLEACGFVKPSPIQRKAIPLGKCGFDLIVQAKSGTGKTCVFTVIALEMLQPDLEKLQVLILAPTREISVQIRNVIASIGNCQNLKVEAFIGGLPLENDKIKLQKCQIAVGAPGRVKHLILDGLMKVDAVRLLVLDEADKLMEENFRQEISSIYLKLPEVKQIVAASATFPPELEDFVIRYMTSPMRISPGKDTFLIGIRQFISIVPSHLSVFIQMKNKLTELCRILSTVPFKQCLVFSNYQSRAESICNELNKAGWPAIHISGSQNQPTRLKAMSSLKEFRCRVFLSTDLTSRGIDAENVNLIVNLDLPYDGPTYLHRIGRAGRYGTHGLAITIVQSGVELDRFLKMLHEMGGRGSQMPIFPKEKLEFDIWETKDEDFEKISSIQALEENECLKATDNEMPKEKLKCRTEQEKETKSKALEKVFACHLEFPQESKINEYEDLVNSSSQFKGLLKGKVIKAESEFTYEDYSPELKSAIIYLEKESCKDFRKHVQQFSEVSKVEDEKNINKALLSGLLDKNKKIGCNDISADGEQSSDLEEFDENLEDGVYYGDNDYADDENDDNNSDDHDEINENSESSESNEESDYEVEGNEEKSIRDSLYVRRWHSMWYSQLAAVRLQPYHMKDEIFRHPSAMY